MDILRNKIGPKPPANKISNFLAGHQDWVQPNVHIQFGAQKLPTGFMGRKFRIASLVLCTTNKPKKNQISLSIKTIYFS
jgi:hypothetical protein